MKAVVFDTETSGLIINRTMPRDKQPYVIEFYGMLVDLRTGKVSKELHFLAKPPVEGFKLEPKIVKITTITDIDIENEKPFEKYATEVQTFLESASVVIGHNLSFDMEMIDIELDRIGRRLKWPKRRICTVEQTLHFKGFRLKLSDLHEYLLNERFDGAHRAKVDVEATTRVASELLKRNII